MKQIHLSSLLLLCIFSLSLAGCGSTSISAPLPTTDSPATDSEVTSTIIATVKVNPTATDEPTETPQPTDPPPPVPCMIAFESDRDGNREIYLMGPDGNDPVNLTNNPSNDTQPAMSADGSQIAFISSRETETCVGQSLYIMNADGEDQDNSVIVFGQISPLGLLQESGSPFQQMETFSLCDRMEQRILLNSPTALMRMDFLLFRRIIRKLPFYRVDDKTGTCSP